MNKTVNLKYIFLLICIYLSVFQNLLQSYFVVFQYFDEALSLSFIIFGFLNLLKKRKKQKLEKSYIRIAILLIIFCFLNLFISIGNNLQPIQAIASDIIIFLKFFLVIFLSNIILNYDVIKKNEKKLLFHINFITIVLLIFTIFNYLFTLYPYEARYGIMANRLFYSHPTYLAAICIFLISLRALTERKFLSFYNITLFAILVSTLRLKAIGGAIAICIMGYLIYKKKKTISISKLAILGIIVFIVAFDQISFYLSNETFARTALLRTSFQIAKDYFPFGTGFGSFGSYYSAVYYSPVYNMYSISTVWGLMRGEAMFVADTFWPMILGQFGISGVITYAYLIILIIKKIKSEFSIDNINLYISKMICLGYLLISSTSESAFANSFSIAFAIIIGIQLLKNNERGEKN